MTAFISPLRADRAEARGLFPHGDFSRFTVTPRWLSASNATSKGTTAEPGPVR